MAKKQTRKSISVSRQTYDKLKAHCEQKNEAMSEVTTKALEMYLGLEDAIKSLKPRDAKPAPVLDPMEMLRPIGSRGCEQTGADSKSLDGVSENAGRG